MTELRVVSLPPEVLNDNVEFIDAVRVGISGQIVRETVELLGGHKKPVAELVGTTLGNLHRT